MANTQGLVLSPMEKGIRGRIELQSEAPFFSFLLMHMELKEMPEIGTAGVMKNSRFIYFNPEWFEKLSLAQIKGTMVHEVWHKALQHLDRVCDRNPMLWNIATDAVINATLLRNNFELPEGGILPMDDQLTVGNTTITDVSEKSPEEVYELIQNEVDSAIKGVLGDEKDKGSHEEWQKDGGGEGDEEGEGGGSAGDGEFDDRTDWRQILSEAAQYAKQQGKLPAGMDRIVDAQFKRRLNWRQIVQAIVVNSLPADWTFMRRSRRTASMGEKYSMPAMLRESIELAAIIDSSGSISQTDLAEFKGLLIELTKSFDNINVHIVVCDAEVHQSFDLTNGKVGEFRKMPIKGGGGTSFIPSINQVMEEKPQTRMILYFTDGYGSFPEPPTAKVIWLLQPPHCEESDVPFGKAICLEKYPIS